MEAIINQVLILFIPVIIGYIFAKRKLTEKSFAKSLSVFLFNVSLPCSLVSAMQVDFEPKMLTSGGIILIISILITLLSYLFGNLLAKILRAKGYEKRIIRFSTAFSNFGFMGYPVAGAFLGDIGVFYATIFSIPLHILVQSLGIATLIRKDGNGKKFKLDYILNPPLAGIYIGLILMLFRIKLPFAIDQTLFLLGNTTTPLAMFLAGLVLTDLPLKSAFVNFRVYIVTAFRLIIIPLLFYFILKLFNLDDMTLKIPVIITMMPIATNLVIVSTTYDGDVTVSAQYVLISTLLSLITIPILGSFFR